MAGLAALLLGEVLRPSAGLGAFLLLGSVVTLYARSQRRT